ncbi:BA75_01392T0 [Komagataella pastoris]|uniref:Mannan endo-1,6-alpha-mannosidase n=1 Tax=Komagataella pastoris TaxID=4922 RepID=A0A1B2J8Q3_PICPA|nr:BA75_01392T0 [Komagataella pastoris]
MWILWLLTTVSALSLDVDSKDSICDATTHIINGMMDYYEGTRYGGTVGMFQTPYYWWQAGEAFGGMIENWFMCDNNTYEEIIYDALLHQTGDNYNYIPANQSTTEGNDDQGFWGFAAMGAAERNFTEPPEDYPSWVALTQAVYNTMWARWDNATCAGGLRWQIFTWNSGYDYKNTISNGCLLHIAARLARFTQNESYGDTAEEVWQWLDDVGFINDQGGTYLIYDGANIVSGECTDITTIEWTYNYGVLMAGCAYMYDFTRDEVWLTRTTTLLSSISIFLNNNVIYEQQCQAAMNCNNDQRSFKSIFSRCLGYTAKLVPSLTDQIMTILTASAEGAAKSCSGGTDGVTCGLNWNIGAYDDMYGLGEQMSALEVITQLLVLDSPAPYSQNESSSKSDPEAGIGSTTRINMNDLDITGKDKAGAAILTVLVLGIFIGGLVWIVL